MSQWAEIRHLHLVEKVPKKEIARRLKLNVKTVHDAVDRPTPPVRVSPARASGLDPWREQIMQWLREDRRTDRLNEIHRPTRPGRDKRHGPLLARGTLGRQLHRIAKWQPRAGPNTPRFPLRGTGGRPPALRNDAEGGLLKAKYREAPEIRVPDETTEGRDDIRATVPDVEPTRTGSHANVQGGRRTRRGAPAPGSGRAGGPNTSGRARYPARCPPQGAPKRECPRAKTPMSRRKSTLRTRPAPKPEPKGNCS